MISEEVNILVCIDATIAVSEENTSKVRALRILSSRH